MPEPKMINVQHISNGFSAYEKTWWEKKYTVDMCIKHKTIFWNINEREDHTNVFLVDKNELFVQCNALFFVMCFWIDLFHLNF